MSIRTFYLVTGGVGAMLLFATLVTFGSPLGVTTRYGSPGVRVGGWFATITLFPRAHCHGAPNRAMEHLGGGRAPYN